MNQKTWDIPTRVLHWALVIAITVQLGTGLFIATPGDPLDLHVHEYIGLAAGLIIVLHWLSSWSNFDLPMLFPWHGEGLRTVKSETLELVHGKLPPGGRCAGLSSFIHGLGLLAVTVMALTGFFIFLVIPNGQGAMANSPHYHAFTVLSEFHMFFAWFVWVYWIGHVATALLHLTARKDGVFADIFIGLARKNS